MLSVSRAPCDVNPPVTDGFPSKVLGMGSFDIFFDITNPNKFLNKQVVLP